MRVLGQEYWVNSTIFRNRKFDRCVRDTESPRWRPAFRVAAAWRETDADLDLDLGDGEGEPSRIWAADCSLVLEAIVAVGGIVDMFIAKGERELRSGAMPLAGARLDKN